MDYDDLACHPKTLFIDFDGVLHDVGVGELCLEGGMMSVAGARLFEWASILGALLALHPEVAVAVHSSWRNFYSDEELQALVPAPLGARIVGSTPTRMSRHEAILCFVSDHRVGSHLILDDMADDFPDGCPELVVCDPARGVSDERVLARVRAWLESPAELP